MTGRNRRDKLNRISDIASQLRESSPAPTEMPDLTSSILGKVDAERPFLNAHTRRMLWVGRSAIGATVALVALAGFLTLRFAPRMLEPAEVPAPLTAVIDRVQTKASRRVEVVQQTLQGAPKQFAELLPPIEPTSIEPTSIRSTSFSSAPIDHALHARTTSVLGFATQSGAGNPAFAGDASGQYEPGMFVCSPVRAYEGALPGTQPMYSSASPRNMLFSAYHKNASANSSNVGFVTGVGIGEVAPEQLLRVSPVLAPIDEAESGLSPR